MNNGLKSDQIFYHKDHDALTTQKDFFFTAKITKEEKIFKGSHS